MDKNVYEIVNDLKIKEKKLKLLEDKKRLFQIEREISNIRFDINTHFMGNKDAYHQTLRSVIDRDESKQLLGYLLVCNESRIKELMEERELLLSSLNDYQKTINIDLRRELSNLELPRIFVKQNDYSYDKNIIDSEVYKTAVNENNSLTICPIYNMKSFRDFRHFYNKVSFKYLEELTKDYEYSLDNKKIGKVLIK